MAQRSHRPRRRRGVKLAAPLLAAAAVTSLAACSSDSGGAVVNLYGGAAAAGFDKIIAECNKEAAGRYTIVGNLLPSDADWVPQRWQELAVEMMAAPLDA